MKLQCWTVCWRSQNSLADTSTTARPILELIKGDCWARCQLCNGIRYVSVVSILRKSLASVKRIFIVVLGISYWMADYSTTGAQIVILFAGGCWAWHQLSNGIRYVSVTSILRSSVFSGGLIRYQAGDILLDGGLLHNTWTDFDTLYGRLLGLMPSSQEHKVHLCSIRTQRFSVFSGEFIRYHAGDILLNGRLLHNHLTDFDSVCGWLLGLTPAFQWYKVGLCHINTQEVAVFCGGCITSQAGDILLDGRLLHSRWTDFDTLCRRLLDLTPAFQLYKVRLCRIKAQEIAVFCGEDLYSTSSPGDILFDGRLLHN